MIKKFSIICVILLFLISLSAVSATDDAVTINNDNNTIGIESSTDLVSDSQNTGNTYTDLSNIINDAEVNSTVHLDKNYAYNNSDSNYQYGIIINKNVNIDGNNHNISVTGSSSTFVIKNANVTLENINFNGGSYDSVVKVTNGQLTLLNCSMQDVNRAVATAGAVGDTFGVSDIVAISNYLENYYLDTNALPSSVVYNGKSYTLPDISYLLSRAVLNYYQNNTSNISVTKLLSAPDSGIGSFNSSINYTQAAYIYNANNIQKGGFTYRFVNWISSRTAPANFVSTNADGKIYYTSFIESFARALTYYGQNNKFPEYMNYYGNIKLTSSTTGVGIYSYNSNLTIKNSIFKNMSGSINGGIYVNLGNLLINNTIFENNTANRGAAIFVDSATNVTIDNSKFAGNVGTQSSANGAVINLYKSSVQLTNSNFTDNKCLSMRGIVELNSCESLVDNCIFNGNEAREAAAIAADGGNKITITNSKFTNNGISGTGFGGVFNSQSTPMEIRNSEFINNSASGTNPWGGVGMFASATFDVINSTFINNTAKNQAMSTDDGKNLGGAIYAQSNATVNIVNSTFISNNAANKGGALYAQGGANFVISGSEFINNSAVNGGAIYSKEGSSSSVKNSYFENNTASSGGAINLYSGNLDVDNSTFVNNSADYGNNTDDYGGAIYVPSGNLDIDNSTFVNNSADYGGAIANNAPSFTLQNSYFENNSATYYGGAIQANSLALQNSTFINNVAKTGGAISSAGSDIYNSTFIGNKAENSAAVEFRVMDSSNIYYCIFINNVGNNTVSTKNVDEAVDLNYNYWGMNDDPNTLVEKGPYTTLDKWITIAIDGNSTTYVGSNYTYNVVFQGENADKLPLFNTNITVVPAIGTLNQSNVLLNNKSSVGLTVSKSGNATLVIGPEYGNLTTYNISSFKIKSSAVINVNNTVYGNDAIVNVVVPSDATGNVTITVNNIAKNATISNGSASAKFEGLTVKNYNVDVIYNGDDKYLSSANTTNFDVVKANPSLVVSADGIVYGNDAVVNVVISSKATGNVTITVNNINKTAKINNGMANATFSGLTAKEYNVSAVYNGDTNYNSVSNSTKLNVAKANSTLVVSADSIVYGENAFVSVIVPGDATGNVTITINDIAKTAKINNGRASATFSGLTAKEYVVSAVYAGDANYKGSSNTTGLIVNKADSPMVVNIPEVIAGENTTITVSVPKHATGKVVVNINNINYTESIVNGSAKVVISPLDEGNYNMTVSFSGDNNYLANTTKYNVTVVNNKEVNLNVSDVVMLYKDGTRLAAVLTDYLGNPIANATLYFTINGKTYNRTTDVNGSASMALNLVSKEYNANVLFNGSDKYNAISKNVTVTINPTIVANDIVKMSKRYSVLCYILRQ